MIFFLIFNFGFLSGDGATASMPQHECHENSEERKATAFTENQLRNPKTGGTGRTGLKVTEEWKEGKPTAGKEARINKTPISFLENL